MASLRKKGKVWYVRVRDESGRQREVKAGPDKSVAQSIARDLEGKIQRVKAGVLDPREAGCLDAERIPITQHVEEYVQELDAKGCVEGHVDGVRKRLTWFLEETKITRLSQLRPSLVDTALKTLRDAGKSDRTVSHYCAALKSFSRWAKKDRRTREDLLADLEWPKIVTENKRAALSPEQAARLVTTTRAGKFRRGMTGEDRSWLYALAIYTGLRRSELQSLTPESFDLDATPPNVALPGRDTKNSDDAVQPLPSHVIPALRSWLATKPRQKPLFPEDRNSALMIRANLKAAGIPSDAYDFHGLRHCYVSQIVQSGASVKDAMELARHSDADLTFNRYAHARLEELSKIVDKLPDLWEKCGKGDGLSIDRKSEAGMEETTHQEPLASDFPTHALWERNGRRIFPTPFPHLVSQRDLTGLSKPSVSCVPLRPEWTRILLYKSYPARIRTWKNRTKTCCDTVSPPGNRACSLATRCSSGKTTRRRKRRFGSSGLCTQGSRAERSDPRPRR